MRAESMKRIATVSHSIGKVSVEFRIKVKVGEVQDEGLDEDSDRLLNEAIEGVVALAADGLPWIRSYRHYVEVDRD